MLEILLALFVFATWSLPAFMPALENIRSTPARREAGRCLGGAGRISELDSCFCHLWLVCHRSSRYIHVRRSQ